MKIQGKYRDKAGYILSFERDRKKYTIVDDTINEVCSFEYEYSIDFARIENDILHISNFSKNETLYITFDGIVLYHIYESCVGCYPIHETYSPFERKFKKGIYNGEQQFEPFIYDEISAIANDADPDFNEYYILQRDVDYGTETRVINASKEELIKTFGKITCYLYGERVLFTIEKVKSNHVYTRFYIGQVDKGEIEGKIKMWHPKAIHFVVDEFGHLRTERNFENYYVSIFENKSNFYCISSTGYKRIEGVCKIEGFTHNVYQYIFGEISYREFMEKANLSTFLLNNFVIINSNGKKGIANINGEIVIPMNYNKILNLGKLIVAGDIVFHISKDGNLSYKSKFPEEVVLNTICYIHEIDAYYLFQSENSNYYLMSENGKIYKHTNLSEYEIEFYDGLYIYTKGTCVLKRTENDNYACSCDKEEWGTEELDYIRKNGGDWIDD